MQKIPVGATIAHAYRFAFGQFLNLLRLTWLPMMAGQILSMGLMPQFLAMRQSLATQSPASFSIPWPLFLLLYAMAMIASFMQITIAFQYGLGRIEASGRWFYFTLARPLWRMAGAFLLLILIMMVLAVVYGLGSLALVFTVRLLLRLAQVSDLAIAAIAVLETVVIFTAGYCGFLFCGVRFGFLLGAATIAQERIGLAESWTLSHRNFWRMFIVSLAVFLPFVVIETGLLAALGIFHVPPPGTPPTLASAIMTARIAAMQALLLHYWYIYLPVFGAMMILFYGLMAGAGSFAWRALTDTDLA
jgi:hypothetical protein